MAVPPPASPRNRPSAAAPGRAQWTRLVVLAAMVGASATLVAVTGRSGAAASAEGQGTPEGDLDRIFAAWDSNTSPGCAVGVEFPGSPEPLLRAWGMSDLEHGIENTPATIFESGSLSKQFTAAAVVLLAQDGVLDLDDDVRDWIPELPDYGAPITLRHMMNHTSGLRDWGSVAQIGGWGRSERTHTHDHVLEITVRQTALNYPPGQTYSYSNTGYNLLAIVVERAAGVPFAEFSKDRIFEPLGLRDTQWRDDYRRIVPGRSGAYRQRDGAWEIDRPIEHVHGNGGLLTTVADLLRWNRALDAAAAGGAAGEPLGGPAFAARMVERGILTDGDTITYALGLMVDSFEGRPSITHTGSTSGYRAYLGRYPRDDLSLAILCNAGNANPGQLGNAVARAFMGVEAPAAPAEPDGGEEVPEPVPSAGNPAEFVGTYTSDEADATWRIEAEGTDVILVRSPGIRSVLRPTGADAFAGPVGDIRFHRDAGGRVVELGVSQARVWDLRFHREQGGG